MSVNSGDLTGKTLGTCTLEKLIGQGGMGAVYLARQRRPERNVAVKVLLPNLAMNDQMYQEFLARFQREANVIARLEHANIIPIYEYGEQDGLTYLVMPYMSGGSLRDILSKRGTISLREVAVYLSQAAAALDYAHGKGVVHRDLKPANFLLHEDGRLMLADFGIARMMEDSKVGSALTGTGTMLGTPEYMAPEMIQGQRVDHRADMYELGIVLFQMLSGRVPFSGDSAYGIIFKHVQNQLPLLHPEIPAIPPAVDAVIQKATAKRPEDRYTSVTEIAQAFQRAISGSVTPGAFQGVGADNEPTVRSNAAANPIVLPPAQGGAAVTHQQQQAYPNTAPPQPTYPNTMPSQQVWPQGSGYPPNYRTVPGNYPAQQYQPEAPFANTPYPPPRRRSQTWLIVASVLLVLVLVGVSVLAANTFLRPSGTTPTATSVPTSAQTATSEATSAATATATTAQATPTQQTTPTPGVTPTPSPGVTPPATLPVGDTIYAAARPGTGCDTGTGKWAIYNGAVVACEENATRITAPSPGLQGIFLTDLPDQAAYPNDYVVQAKFQQDGNTAKKFGFYFRNQPGDQLGTYVFMIQADSTWVASVFDNTGKVIALETGRFGDIHAPVTLAVVVSGQQFSFYADGNLLGSTSDPSYPTGSAGIVVEQGGNVVVSDFTVSKTG